MRIELVELVELVEVVELFEFVVEFVGVAGDFKCVESVIESLLEGC